ncbi:MAG: hypothetical protein JWO36_3033 [Myxococcales bacterium]|nr:hypothetical protein [Myxococcales bacterium]
MSRVALVICLLVTGLARADGTRLEVELGKTVERDVGIATGSFCDDPSLVTTDLVTRNDRNVWIVRGAKLGTTLCRVGTDPTRPHFVFEVHVTRPRRSNDRREIGS